MIFCQTSDTKAAKLRRITGTDEVQDPAHRAVPSTGQHSEIRNFSEEAQPATNSDYSRYVAANISLLLNAAQALSHALCAQRFLRSRKPPDDIMDCK